MRGRRKQIYISSPSKIIFHLTDLWFSCIRVYWASLSIKETRTGDQNEGRFVLPIAVLAMAGVDALTGASQVCSVARNRFALIRHWVSRTALWGKECVCSIRLAAVVPSRALARERLSRARFNAQEVVNGEERTRWLIASPPFTAVVQPVHAQLPLILH